MVDFIGIERVQELVARRGAARFIEELAAEIESGFPALGARSTSRRATPRIRASGVIELMPASRRAAVRLQVRERPPEEHRAWACSR